MSTEQVGGREPWKPAKWWEVVSAYEDVVLPCEACSGHGRIPSTRHGFIQGWSRCRECDGRGYCIVASSDPEQEPSHD